MFVQNADKKSVVGYKKSSTYDLFYDNKDGRFTRITVDDLGREPIKRVIKSRIGTLLVLFASFLFFYLHNGRRNSKPRLF